MKRINLLAGVLFVLVGFCAGVGFSLFSAKIEAQGRPEPPPMALKTVEHDATLTGDGTTVAPLGLANGAVTAPKLSAAAVPSVGQVLGFNGANLAWQDAPVGGVRVVDSLGQDVGPLEGTGRVWRHIGTLNFLLTVSTDGFFQFDTTVLAAHTSGDCSGDRYLTVFGSALLRRSQNTSTQLFYASDPIQQLTIQSIESVSLDNPSLPGLCQVLSEPSPAAMGLLAIFNLADLGLTPPFHLEF